MPNSLRNALTFLGVLAVSLVTSLYLTPAWSTWFVIGRSFTSRYVWWSQPDLLNVMDESLILLIAGVILTLTLHVRHPIAWALFLGIAFGAARWSLGWYWIEPDAEPSVYFWVYGGYFLPTFGAVVGALGGIAWRARRSRHHVA